MLVDILLLLSFAIFSKSQNPQHVVPANFPLRKQWYIAMGSGSCMRSEERDITVPPSLPNTGDFAQSKAHGRERVQVQFIQKKKALKSWVRVHGMMAIHCYIELRAPICNNSNNEASDLWTVSRTEFAISCQKSTGQRAEV